MGWRLPVVITVDALGVGQNNIRAEVNLGGFAILISVLGVDCGGGGELNMKDDL